jgi:integrase
MIRNYITPAIGDHRLNALRPEHLNHLYVELVDHAGAGGPGLALKTVYDVHIVIRSALDDARRRHLVDQNVALDTRPPRATTRSRRTPEIWSAEQLAHFLARSTHLRLYPALHLAATTGLRRGELAGLRWGDWRRSSHRLSIARSRQSVQGKTVEVPTKTAASRRCIDLDPDTEQVLERWRQSHDGNPVGPDHPLFTNRAGAPVHPESITQLFDRQVARLGLPRVRFYDLRHHMPRSSSPTTSRSRSCPNGSATPTPGSRWPPTNTCCREWEPAPPPGSPRSSLTHETIAPNASTARPHGGR